jgi:hypothetical protein
MKPTKTRAERRKKARVNLTRGLLARHGTMGAIIQDITDEGARIEHFNRLELRKTAVFRFVWNKKPVEVVAEVMSCRIHRFAGGEKGTNVYQSGLRFVEYKDDAKDVLAEMIETLVARSYAEQVANLRGLGPVLESESNMPVFRSGLVEGEGMEAGQKGADRYIPDAKIAMHRGYLRCTLNGRRWDKKWTSNPDQPTLGFTIPASEPPDLVDQLCMSYLKGDDEQRRLIVQLAQISVEQK